MSFANRIHAARLLLVAAAIINLAPALLAQSGPAHARIRPLEAANIPGATSPMVYHPPGPVITGVNGTVPLYLIWYGAWTTNQKNIITTFLTNLSGSPWLNIVKEYSVAGQPITATLTLAGQITSTASLGTSLTDTDVQTIVTDSFSSLPSGGEALYLVLTGPNIKQGIIGRTGKFENNFCAVYCGWHSDYTYTVGNPKTGTKTNIKYLWVGDPETCPNNCAPTPNEKASPNGDVGVDAALSIIAHEISEAITDPDLNAWYDAYGNEIADKCEWTFGTTTTVTVPPPPPPGSTPLAVPYQYNMTLGGKQYMIQQLWKLPQGVQKTGGCYMQ